MAEDILEKDQDTKVDKKEQKRLKKEENRRKKEEKKSSNKNKKGGKVFRFLLILIVLVALLFGISFVIVKNDLFGLSDSVLSDTLEQIPFINEMLVDPNDTETKATREELLVDVDAYEKEIEALLGRIELLEQENNDLTIENDRLSDLEDNYLDFRTEKEQFDKAVANSDPISYMDYYSSIYPENAEDIYREIVQNVETDAEVRRYIARFEALDSGNCAKILEELIYTDLDLVVNILDNMTIEKSADVLEQMDTVNASTILKRLTP